MWFKVLTVYTCLVGLARLSSAGTINKEQVMAECMQKYPNLKEEDVYGSFKVKAEVADENNMDAKCWFQCVTVQFKTLDENGNIIDLPLLKSYYAQKYASKMTADEVAELMEKCAVSRAYTEATHPCEKIYQFHKCHMKVFVQK